MKTAEDTIGRHQDFSEWDGQAQTERLMDSPEYTPTAL